LPTLPTPSAAVAVLLEMVRIWPAPVPDTMRTCEFAHWFTVHVLAELVSVVAPPAVAVPVANDTNPDPCHEGVATSFESVPITSGRAMPSVTPVSAAAQVFVAKS
jgi:hypothetical protein